MLSGAFWPQSGDMNNPTANSAAGGPRVLLRLEGLAVLIASVVAYRQLGGSWGLFAALFLVPDLSMLGYLAGARVGAVTYNTVHSYLFAAGLAALGAVLGVPGLLLVAAIASAHVGFDRALGYGLKYGTGFGHTHLGVREGRKHAVAAKTSHAH
jgi:hypothetical protein